MRKELLGDQHV